MKQLNNTNRNILFILSYYSALQKSIENNNWVPEGMPAVSKLFEGLYKRKLKFNVVFTENLSNKKRCKKIKNKRFDNIFYVYPLKLSNKFYFKVLRLFSIFKFYYFIKSILNNKSTLIYVDRSNLLIGALLSFSGYNVLLRFHGVSNFYNNYKSLKFKILNPLNLLGLLAPFKLIISSEDGSPSNLFLKKFKKTKNKYVLINGVDDLSTNKLYKKSKLNIFKNNFLTLIFIGRFSNDKGILEFIRTLIKLKQKLIKVNSIIIGDGPLKDQVIKIIKENNLKNIYITGQIDHSKVYTFLKIADIYISLNKIGNLSNTVLEAFNSKKCIAVLDECKKTKRDISTKNFFKNNLIYIDRNDIVNDLTKKITMLIKPKSFALFKERIENSKIKILDWNSRIENEINLMLKYLN